VSCHEEGRCGRHAHARTQKHARSLWEHTHKCTHNTHTNEYTSTGTQSAGALSAQSVVLTQTSTNETHAHTSTYTQSAGALSECSIRNDNNKRLISENGTDPQKLCLYWQI